MRKEMKGSKSSHLSIAIELGASFIKYDCPSSTSCNHKPFLIAIVEYRGIENNPIAALSESLGLHLHEVPAGKCLLYDDAGDPVLGDIEERAQLRYSRLNKSHPAAYILSVFYSFQARLDHALRSRYLKKIRDEEQAFSVISLDEAGKASGLSQERNAKLLKKSASERERITNKAPTCHPSKHKEEIAKEESHHESEEDEDDIKERQRRAELYELVSSFTEETSLQEVSLMHVDETMAISHSLSKAIETIEAFTKKWAPSEPTDFGSSSAFPIDQ